MVSFQGLNLNIVEIVPPRFRGQRFTLYKPLSLSDENSKSEEEREAERKEKAKQRRSRTNFSLEQVPDAAVFEWNLSFWFSPNSFGKVKSPR